ncbi:ABC transporter substrate-binding protein [Pseudoalteromonas sp. DL2-H2.2]|uniref:ABC transporter substrate-binding protein n=1 Tax=Pseudoalteromonas sp. DL2-H2.2 TaxID=2908889 RepID=UPI001F3DA046|nr:ABC transporter substrate-binding protein [Pseudoalteromonas sp. DL2-H2.2]MCF2909109.1 ABC transporter substrate-binding protein [Pseudoalteromonas sp. DL2-H2.2]
MVTSIGLWVLSLQLNISTTQPVQLLYNDWTSQQVLSHIVANIFTELGYQTEFIEAKTEGQWFLLKAGMADVQVEVWEGTMADKYAQLMQSQVIVDLGDYSLKTREDWWYPLYVKQHCPGLPHWQALLQCAEVFARPGSQGKGVYIAGPWEKPDRARIRALQLPFVVEQVESGEALWKKLAIAHKIKQPILMFNWTPNWVGAVYPGEFVEFPDFDVRCETEPGWGVNPKFLFDCGNPKSGWLKKIVSTEFFDQHPCLAKGLRQFDMNSTTLEQLAAMVNLENFTPALVAKHWLENNQATWRKWFVACIN